MWYSVLQEKNGRIVALSALVVFFKDSCRFTELIDEFYFLQILDFISISLLLVANIVPLNTETNSWSLIHFTCLENTSLDAVDHGRSRQPTGKMSFGDDEFWCAVNKVTLNKLLNDDDDDASFLIEMAKEKPSKVHLLYPQPIHERQLKWVLQDTERSPLRGLCRWLQA